MEPPTLTVFKMMPLPDLHIDQTDRDIFSTQVSLTQMILLCVNLIRNSWTQNQNFRSWYCNSSHLMKQLLLFDSIFLLINFHKILGSRITLLDMIKMHMQFHSSIKILRHICLYHIIFLEYILNYFLLKIKFWRVSAFRGFEFPLPIALQK